jgi:hypothetical protein
MMLFPESAAIVLADDDLKIRFVTWIGTEIQRISQKKNRLAVFNSLLLKASGASHSAVSRMKKSFGYIPFPIDSSFLGALWASPPLISELGLLLPIAEMQSFLSLFRMKILGSIGLIIMLNPMLLVQCLSTKNYSRACFGQLME